MRQRKANAPRDASSTNGSSPEAEKQLTFQIESRGEAATDFSKDGGFQKCVRFSNDNAHLLTGGADGHLRMWKVGVVCKILKWGEIFWIFEQTKHVSCCYEIVEVFVIVLSFILVIV